LFVCDEKERYACEVVTMREREREREREIRE